MAGEHRLELPKGVYYEEKRHRYRVRLYKNNRVVHRSYHKDLADALKAYYEAQAARRSAASSIIARPLATIAEQVMAVRSGVLVD